MLYFLSYTKITKKKEPKLKTDISSKYYYKKKLNHRGAFSCSDYNKKNKKKWNVFMLEPTAM